ncbi:prepilin-type N-terminal cleavage/methylation domain-containing protein [Thermodesulfatator autotrophicus]|uniref:Prepilin-type N-terminal cleavage/methylation domain-containing protein n=1 Tax=Thermodesulfatator autotrophicus TaxID=1795632 RepID=A0A177E6X4_9BACT|nr:prepilin-type N-terminal cleavage/methylation domain-containing protein [Thermodesulfatator autotrophicus]OAG27697.1 hypothetical protein TH606_05740 [Thermodesulfatator autotrophicus]
MRGFSLVESLVAIIIFLIIIVALGPLLITGIKTAKINEMRDETLYKVNKVLEHLISKPYDDSCLDVGTNNTCQNDNGCCGDESGNSNIGWTVLNGSENNTKKIEVTGVFNYLGHTGQVKIGYIKGNWP